MFDLRQAFDWLSAACLYGDGSCRVHGVCTDSRSLKAGDLFVALRGERFDAHDFIERAQQAGAAAVMFERLVPGLRAPALRVPDTRRARGELAAGWRRRFDLPLITVAGSNGKTTGKEMISGIRAEHAG
ncbi:MAG: Mur ligase domain-containing protein, partial [Burkholderiaceae bacterium]